MLLPEYTVAIKMLLRYMSEIKEQHPSVVVHLKLKHLNNSTD